MYMMYIHVCVYLIDILYCVVDYQFAAYIYNHIYIYIHIHIHIICFCAHRFCPHSHIVMLTSFKNGPRVQWTAMKLGLAFLQVRSSSSGSFKVRGRACLWRLARWGICAPWLNKHLGQIGQYDTCFCFEQLFLRFTSNRFYLSISINHYESLCV